jgi:8-oxo-dGTP pyrophosphatase MutT (NUDIX family)
MAETLEPRPAATVMMLRDAPGGCEVLMLRRNLNSDFVGGAYVFPGGGVDAADGTSTAEHVVEGLSDAEASARLELTGGGLAYYVACLRELFEEAGLLVARDGEDRLVRFDDDELARRFAAHRRQVNAREARFLDVVSAEGLRLDLRQLEYISHWVTPVGPPRRYDTRFFVAVAPEAQIAAHDDGETVADVWVRPADALERGRRGELELIFPTIRNLQSIERFDRAEDVLGFARSLTAIPRIEPRIVSRDGGIDVLIPGDDGFEEAG